MNPALSGRCGHDFYHCGEWVEERAQGRLQFIAEIAANCSILTICRGLPSLFSLKGKNVTYQAEEGIAQLGKLWIPLIVVPNQRLF